MRFIILLALILMSVSLGAQSKTSPITIKILSSLLPTSLNQMDHWSKGLSLTLSPSILKAFTELSPMLWQGEISMNFSGLPGKAKVSEKAILKIAQKEKVFAIEGNLEITSSTLTDIAGPTRNTALTATYKLLRTPEKIATYVPLSDKMVSVTLVDIFPTGKSDAQISMSINKDQNGKPSISYLAKVPLSLDAFLVQAGNDALELEKNTINYTASFSWDGKNAWTMQDGALILVDKKKLDYVSSKFKPEFLQSAPFLAKLGIDLVWGESKALKSAKIISVLE